MLLGQIFAKNAKNDPKTLFEASKSVSSAERAAVCGRERWLATPRYPHFAHPLCVRVSVFVPARNRDL